MRPSTMARQLKSGAGLPTVTLFGVAIFCERNPGRRSVVLRVMNKLHRKYGQEIAPAKMIHETRYKAEHGTFTGNLDLPGTMSQ